MCGRFALYNDREELESHLGLMLPEDWIPHYNIAPTQKSVIIRENPAGIATLDRATWGLIPHWARDKTMAGKMFNARTETVMEKPSFKKPFQRQRCLIPATGFFEWKALGKSRTPFFITQPDGLPWTLAGIWDRNDNLPGGSLESFSILTTQANPNIQHLHDRMPIAVSKGDWQNWLTSQEPEKTLAHLIELSTSTRFQFLEVDPMVNKAGVDLPGCIAPPAKGLFG